MNYKETKDFDVDGTYDKTGISIATYEDDSVVLVVHTSFEYGHERSAEIKLSNLNQIDSLIVELVRQREILCVKKSLAQAKIVLDKSSSV